MKFNIGDKVSFLNEKGGGVIVKIFNKTTVLVQIEDGFEIPFNINDLLLITPGGIAAKPANIIKEVTKKRSEFTKKDVPVKKTSKKIELEKEIDLHLEELIDDTKGMRNGEKLEIQLDHFRKELEKAILNKHTRKITFIHGVGVGRLKQEIYKILETYDGIRFYDAPYRKYGFGATEVIIR